MATRNILVLNCGSSSLKFALISQAHATPCSPARPSAWTARRPHLLVIPTNEESRSPWTPWRCSTPSPPDKDSPCRPS